MKSLDFFPYCYPTYEGVVELPEIETDYKTVELGAAKERKKEKTAEVNIDIRKLTKKKEKNIATYSVKELKSIAKTLDIKGSSNMNKENLIKYIRLKLKK